MPLLEHTTRLCSRCQHTHRTPNCFVTALCGIRLQGTDSNNTTFNSDAALTSTKLRVIQCEPTNIKFEIQMHLYPSYFFTYACHKKLIKIYNH